MIAAVTAGWRITNASARWMSEMPDSSASRARASAASSLAWLTGSERSYRCGIIAERRELNSSEPFRQRPESQPPASGLQAITPIPNSWQVGSTSASIARASSEYGGCSQR